MLKSVFASTDPKSLNSYLNYREIGKAGFNSKGIKKQTLNRLK